MLRYDIYRKDGKWKKFLSSDNQDKIKNTIGVISSQLQETVALAIVNDESNVIFLAFNQPPLLLENEELIA